MQNGLLAMLATVQHVSLVQWIIYVGTLNLHQDLQTWTNLTPAISEAYHTIRLSLSMLSH